jgi:vacuolar protein sorting-associated protein 11
MSLRWKLLRFLTSESLLPPTPSPDHAAASDGHSKFIGLNSTPPAPPKNLAEDLLRRFSHTSSRASCSHCSQGAYAFALPRGVVEVFSFGTDGIQFPQPLIASADGPVISSSAPPVATPSHFTIVAHESRVTAVYVVARPAHHLPIVVTAGLDGKSVSVKMWIRSNASPGISGSPGLFAQDSILRQGYINNAPVCTAVLRTSNDIVPTALAILDGQDPESMLRSLAVGFEDGSVVFFNGDLLRERFTRIRVAPAPGEMRDARPVTSLAFLGHFLMCVTEQSVAALRPAVEDKPASDVSSSSLSDPDAHAAAFQLTSKGLLTNGSVWNDSVLPKRYFREILDSRGALERDTVACLPSCDAIVVAREEALYFFNKDGRGQCLAFPSEVPNTCIAAVGPYVIHATRPSSIIAYDIATKVIAYRGNGDVMCLFADEVTRTVIICMEDGSIVRLSEVALDTRVRMLLTRGLYTSAIALAKPKTVTSLPGASPPLRLLSTRQSYFPSPLFTDAVRQYALFLMKRGDFDSAALQLIGIIGGTIEPSWIITRLVEQPGLRSGLRSYLEALHYAGCASFVHTRVLITCYRHDRARTAILRLPQHDDETTADKHIIQVLSDVKWSEPDVDTAIDICCEASLYGVAESVARKRGRNIRLAYTLVEHLGDIPGGLSLLRTLSDKAEAMRVADVCGRTLLTCAAKEFVPILVDIVRDTSVVNETTRSNDSPGDHAMLRVMQIAHLFVDRPRWLAVLLESVLNKSSSAIASAHFSTVWIMLYEASTRVDVDGGAKTGRSALEILQSRTAKIDLHDALRISELYGHGPCLEYVYEHLRLYRELAQHLKLTRDVYGLMRACRRHGKREPYLWLEAIRLIAPLARDKKTSSAGAGAKSGIALGEETTIDMPQALTEAIQGLDSSGTLTPVEIIDAVCDACPEGEWSLMQHFFEQKLAQLTAGAQENEARAVALATESTDLRAKTAQLGEAVIIKPRLCGVCDDALTLPAVHFFCGHSFHAACVTPSRGGEASHCPIDLDCTVGDGSEYRRQSPRGNELSSGLEPSVDSTIDENVWDGANCPRCSPQLDAIASMRSALAEKNGRHEDFFRLLRGARSDGGFATVIGYLSRSAFL